MMSKVGAKEFQRAFGRWRAIAHREPVTVTSHGRDDLVVLAADEYARLKRHEQRAFHVSELPEEVIDELGNTPIAEEAQRFDHEYP
jgi:prevent-host-death family protein